MKLWVLVCVNLTADRVKLMLTLLRTISACFKYKTEFSGKSKLIVVAEK